MKNYSSFDKLGAPFLCPVKLDWRSPSKEEIKSGELVGKLIRYKKSKQHTFQCLGTDWVSLKKPAIVHFTLGSTYINNVQFFLPTQKVLNNNERLDWVMNNLEVESYHLPKSGCSLHGDIDLILYMKDNEELYIPWNY